MTLVKYAPARRAVRHHHRPFPSYGFKRNPGVNVIETNDTFELALAVPGISKSQIDIQVDDDQLKITADVSIDDNINYLRKEFDYSKFQKVFDMPETVDQTQINAKLTNGVLHISLSKKEEAKKLPPQSIKIK